MMRARNMTASQSRGVLIRGTSVGNRRIHRLNRYWAVLSVLLAFAVLGGSAIAQESTENGITEQQVIFGGSDAPDPPFDLHQSMLRFVPGAEAPPHVHGGPGYINVLQGELTLYEDGEQNVYHAGDSLVETPDKHYRGGNYADEDMILMVTYLIPDGEDVTTVVDDPESPNPPEIDPEPLAEAIFGFAEAPDSFDVVHTVSTLQPGAGTEPKTARGDTLITTISGSVDLDVNGDSSLLAAGEAMLVERDREFAIENSSESEAQVMSTELVPDVHSVLPTTGGATVDRTMAMWLLVMTGAALLVVGGVLRLTSVRFR